MSLIENLGGGSRLRFWRRGEKYIMIEENILKKSIIKCHFTPKRKTDEQHY